MIDREYVEEAKANGVNILGNVDAIESSVQATIDSIIASVQRQEYSIARASCHRLAGDLITIGAIDSCKAIEGLKHLLVENINEAAVRQALMSIEHDIRVSLLEVRLML